MATVQRLVLFALGVFVLGYGVVCALVWAGQRSLIFPAPRAAVPLPPNGGPLTRVGEDVLLYRPGPPGAPCVVHFHGNAEQLLDQEGLADVLAAQGLGFLAVEYPGYGWAAGTPSEHGLYAAAERALSWLRTTHGIPPERVVLMGRSLGTGVAVEMARRGHGARLVLVSPYTSMGDMAAAVFPWLPGRLLVRDRFDSLGKAPALRVPTLVVHGERDEVVPAAQGRALAATLPGARLLLVPGAGHDDVLERDWGERRPLALVVRFAQGG